MPVQGTFIPVQDVVFGGELANEEHFSVVRKIISSRAHDDTACAVFDLDMIVEIGNV